MIFVCSIESEWPIARQERLGETSGQRKEHGMNLDV